MRLRSFRSTTLSSRSMPIHLVPTASLLQRVSAVLLSTSIRLRDLMRLRFSIPLAKIWPLLIVLPMEEVKLLTKSPSTILEFNL